MTSSDGSIVCLKTGSFKTLISQLWFIKEASQTHHVVSLRGILRQSRRSVTMEPAPVTLEGRHVRLEPLALDHHDRLVEAASDGALWE